MVSPGMAKVDARAIVAHGLDNVQGLVSLPVVETCQVLWAAAMQAPQSTFNAAPRMARRFTLGSLPCLAAFEWRPYACFSANSGSRTCDAMAPAFRLYAEATFRTALMTSCTSVMLILGYSGREINWSEIRFATGRSSGRIPNSCW